MKLSLVFFNFLLPLHLEKGKKLVKHDKQTKKRIPFHMNFYPGNPIKTN